MESSVFISLFLLTFAMMIVANMNLHEVYDTLLSEMPKLDWKRDALFPKVRKEMGKRMRFANYMMFDYKIPSSNNQYIIYFIASIPSPLLYLAISVSCLTAASDSSSNGPIGANLPFMSSPVISCSVTRSVS